MPSTRTRFEPFVVTVLLVLCTAAFGQTSGTVPPEGAAAAPKAAPSKQFSQEELDQLLAPIALYPDALLAQIFMAATYPLEVVEAERWVKQNKSLEGTALTAALEQQTWDPSVKSLVNFPQVLAMMSEKLDWTSKLGDALLGQQKQVMDSVQKLRAKAQGEGNLKSGAEQKVVVEEQVIRIESTSPEVIYVPTYDPTVVYGSWWYTAYPPYDYYPTGWVAGTTWAFGAGCAAGAAWGYAWGNCGWHNGDIDIDCNRNLECNRNLDRGRYASDLSARSGARTATGASSWQHDAAHRRGVSYRDSATQARYQRGGSTQAAGARADFRGHADAGRQGLAGGGAEAGKGRATGSGGREAAGSAQKGKKSTSGALDGSGRKGSTVKKESSRGRTSLSGGGRSGGSRSGGGTRGGGGRGGGGRGGGGRR